MNQKRFSDAMNEIDNKYVDEAIRYNRKSRKPSLIKWGTIAACLAMMLVLSNALFPLSDGMVVSAYSHGTDDEITSAGVVMNSGTISDTGEMKGKPLMFYLSGENISTVRFSCKNQQLCFMDWTEQREEYGNAQNFTVTYGEDKSEYYYLTIDWVPDAIIRELTDNDDSRIATLPEDMRGDIIVMEITFANGKTATKALQIFLLDNGSFFAAFDDYKIRESDTFVKRPDSEAIPRDTLYAQDAQQSCQEPLDIQQAEEAARAYYSKTVFDIISIEVEDQREDEIVFSVCASKGGIPQEPNRTITLRLKDGVWEVTGEGY